jgi:hypothetical protein
MSGEKYIGLEVHQATISVAVMDSQGKLIMESIVETKASSILEFWAGLRGTLSLTFEEGTWAGWLYDLLKPHVAKLVVCNPRKNALHLWQLLRNVERRCPALKVTRRFVALLNLPCLRRGLGAAYAPTFLRRNASKSNSG